MAPDPQVYPYERAWSYTVWLLSRRAYTRAELREKLARKEASEETIGRVLARLEELGYVDDNAFAEQFVRSRRHRKGRIALRRELRRKGVAEEVIDGTLEPLGEATQIDAALEVLSKNAWRFRKDDPRKNRAKAFAFLARRGFTGDVVRAAVERSTWLDEGGA